MNHPAPPIGWVEEEVKGCRFPDARLDQRFGSLLGMIAHGIGDSIPAACQDWANTKAAYRFLSNERVTEEEILAGHFQASAARTTAVKGILLVLHDTSEFVNGSVLDNGYSHRNNISNWFLVNVLREWGKPWIGSKLLAWLWN